MQDSAPVFVQPVKGSDVFAAVGKSAKFSFRFTGGFDHIDFGPSNDGFIQTVAIRVTSGASLTFQYLHEYLERISWAGDEKKTCPVEAVFILSNVSQGDSRKYICKIVKDVMTEAREIELIVTGNYRRRCKMDQSVQKFTVFYVSLVLKICTSYFFKF